MMNDKFILRKEDLPDELRKENLVQALDGLFMNPMEREMFKKKLAFETLPYRDDLVREFIRFYKTDPSFFNIEIMGLDNNIVNQLESGFKEHLREAFDVMYYEIKSKSPNAFRLLVINKTTLKQVRTNPFKTDLAIETRSRAPNIVLECVGYLDIGIDDRLVLCIIFDRFYNKHGFVVFGLDFKEL